jgi:hypothetical protein
MIPIATKGDYIITFEAEPEHIGMRHHFIKECAWSEKDYRKLRDSRPAWFCAKIAVWYDGQEIGTSYLGCCCYDTEEQFWRSSDYIPQMIDEAVEEADKARGLL